MWYSILNDNATIARAPLDPFQNFPICFCISAPKQNQGLIYKIRTKNNIKDNSYQT